MKHLVFSILFFVGMTAAMSQTLTFEALQKAKEKSDKDILDEKKSLKISTWEKRGKLYLDMYLVNTRNLYKGMPSKGMTGAELLVGKPNKIMNQGNKEQWQYDRINLNFEGGELVDWEETETIDPKALDKSYEAYKHASTMEGSDKFKNKMLTKQNMSSVRSQFVNRGLDLFAEEKFGDAKNALAVSLEIYESFPRFEADTSYSPGVIAYYTGVIAENAKEYSCAVKFYQKAIDFSYEPAKSTHYLANAYKADGNNEKFIETVEKGFEKYPKSAELLIDLINFYLEQGDTQKALTYLDKGIEADPTNATFYFAKGTVYDRIAVDSTLDLTSEEKKANLTEAKEAYEKSIEVDPTFFNAYFNLAVYYNNIAAELQIELNTIPLKEVERYERVKAEANELLEKSLPYMQTAHEINPTDASAMRTIISIYRSLGKYDEAKEVQEKLDALPANGIE